MKAPHEVIKAPLISEKGTALTESANQVLFKVRPNANKIEVKQAVEQMFKVKVEQVRMARYLGKVRRIGRSMGRRPDWKKAYVTLKEVKKRWGHGQEDIFPVAQFEKLLLSARSGASTPTALPSGGSSARSARNSSTPG